MQSALSHLQVGVDTVFGTQHPILSLDVRGGLLAAAGKGGHVALWGLDGSSQEEGVPPLIAAKLHRGWVADVQVLGRTAADDQTGASMLVLVCTTNVTTT